MAVPGISIQIWLSTWSCRPRSPERTVAPRWHRLVSNFGVKYELIILSVLRKATLSSPADESVAIRKKLNAAEESRVHALWLSVSFDDLPVFASRSSRTTIAAEDSAVGAVSPREKYPLSNMDRAKCVSRETFPRSSFGIFTSAKSRIRTWCMCINW